MKKTLVIAVAVVALIVGGAWYVKSRAKQVIESAKEAKSRTTMDMFVQTIGYYHQSHNQNWPDNLDQVADLLGGKEELDKLMHNPSTGDYPGYEYVKPTRALGSDPEAMVYQLRNGKRDENFYIGWANGTVRKAGD